MHAFLHAYRTTFRRFAWEIAAFWLLCLPLIGLSSPGSPDRYLSFQPRMQWGLVEIIAAAWLSLRLILSESKLLTQGSWRIRPLPRWAVGLAPFAVLGSALLPSLLWRAIVIERSVAPDAAQWSHILDHQFAPAVGIALALILATKAIAALLGHGRGPMDWGRKIALAAVLLGLLVSWFHPWGMSRLLMTLYQHDTGGYGGNPNYGGDVPGIQELLPRDSTYLGDWGSWSEPVDRRREVMRIPLTPGLVARQPGIVASVSKRRTLDQQLHLEVDFKVADQLLATDLRRAALVIRYPEHTYAFASNPSHATSSSSLFLSPQQTVRRGGVFPSPLGLPGNRQTWDELLAGAELILFVPDPTRPKIVAPARVDPQKIELPQDAPLEQTVARLLDQLDFNSDWQQRESLKQQARALPAAAIPFLLARHPWSDMTWQDVIRDFLLAHAGGSEKPALLARFPHEPRLGEVLIAKGWAAEALPQLKRFARDRLPLDATSLATLLKEKDPALSADLAALVARLPEGAEELEPLLLAQPGFDWPAFVRDGWLRRKYAFRWPATVAPFDFWAAREGDASALRCLGEQAARGEKWQREKLPDLIAEAPPEPLDYLRENLDRLTFDASTRKWRR